MKRRTFLKLSAVLGAALALPPRSLRLASALPLPFPHTRLANPDTALDPREWDALLIPAYRAAEWIQRGWLAPLTRCIAPGRAHDPESAFTHPYRFHWHRSLLDNWPRLTAALALQHSGYSPNDTHPGHLALALRALPHTAALNARGVLVEYDWVTAGNPAGQAFLAAQIPARAPTPLPAPPLLPWPAWAYHTLASYF